MRAPTLPAGEARLVLGLGNPGERYAATRHNLGFQVIDELARRRRVGVTAFECNALVGETEAAGAPLILAKPQTFMNRSGYAARCLVERRGLALDRLLVVFDEAALPLGQIRLKPGGGPAGHRGLESVLGELRTDQVARLRLGIAPAESPPDLVELVLAPFGSGEIDAVEEMIGRAADACDVWAADGVEAAMNRFNGRLSS